MLFLKWLLLGAALVWTTPVQLTLSMILEEKSRYTVKISVYGISYVFRGKPEVMRFFLRKKKKALIETEDAVDLFKRFVRKVPIFNLKIWGRMSLEDAAETALVSAALQGAPLAIGNAMRVPVCCRIVPDFQGGGCVLRTRCIVCFRAGDIIAVMPTFLRLALIKRAKGE